MVIQYPTKRKAWGFLISSIMVYLLFQYTKFLEINETKVFIEYFIVNFSLIPVPGILIH
jgi:hypothetical protein